LLVDAIKRDKPSRVLGLDTNTKSIGFCLFEDGVPVKWGKVMIDGADIYEKVYDARVKAKVLVDLGPVDYVAIESAIMGRSADVAIKMAMIVGACLSAVLSKETKVKHVAPMSWQAFIGNRVLTKDDKQKIKDENPDKSESWYQNANRRLRKARTMKWVKDTFDIEIADDDVSDAFGIGYWGVKNL
jgi:Holliday junction resolvasome RuvABC endonuclease subunit